MTAETCTHNYDFQGTYYTYSQHKLSGGSAYARIYFERYYCNHCLSVVDMNARTIGNSYMPPMQGTVESSSRTVR